MKSTQRRLAAIMFTDMESYTALMQQDEVKAKIWRSKHMEVLQLSQTPNLDKPE